MGLAAAGQTRTGWAPYRLAERLLPAVADLHPRIGRPYFVSPIWSPRWLQRIALRIDDLNRRRWSGLSAAVLMIRPAPLRQTGAPTFRPTGRLRAQQGTALAARRFERLPT